MLTPEFLKLLELLEGNFEKLCVYAFLCTAAEDHSPMVSVRKIAALLHIGRPRLIKILGELKTLGLIDHEGGETGTRLVLSGTTLVLFRTTTRENRGEVVLPETSLVSPTTTLVLPEATKRVKKPQTIETLEVRELFLTGSQEFLEYGLSAHDVRSHSATPNGVLLDNSSPSSLSESETGTEIGNGETVVDSPLSGSPKSDPEFKGSSIQKKKPRQKKPKKEKPPLTQEQLDLGSAWLAYAKRAMSWTQPPKSWTVEKFASELGKICHRKKFKVEWMREVLTFIEKDNFWYQNALSPASLSNKGNNGLQKIDNIIGKMKPNWMKQQERMQSWDRPLTDEELANPFLIQG